MTPTLQSIETECVHYAKARNELAEAVDNLNEQIEALKRKHLPGIRREVAKAAQLHACLKADIEANPDLFTKPRTHTFHGIKVGFEKGKGRVEFDDPDKVVERIHKQFTYANGKLSAAGELLLDVKETPNKTELKNLTAAELRQLGCSLVAAGDQVVIKPTDSEVDKTVAALLKDATTEAQ